MTGEYTNLQRKILHLLLSLNILYYSEDSPIINKFKTIYMLWHIHTYPATAPFRICMPLPGPLPSSPLCVPSVVLPHLSHPLLPIPFNLPVGLQKLNANQPLFFLISPASFPSSLTSPFHFSIYIYFLFLSLLEKSKQSEHTESFCFNHSPFSRVALTFYLHPLLSWV